MASVSRTTIINKVSLLSIVGTLALSALATSFSPALSAATKTVIPKTIDPTKVEAQPALEMLKNFKGKNQIKLLNNRFRIDYEVEELLLLLFRKRGSKPVVLVRPDGSKIYVTAAETGEVDWHADVSYDLIRLKNPMPGPWQALGIIEDSSKILVLSDVKLEVSPLPKTVFQSERIKSKANITNAKEMIRDPALRDVVRLRAYLYSTNNAEYDNFGAGIYTLGEFFDDGRELDEKPRDGEFTVQYDFNCEVGLWTPKFRAQAELFTREIVQDDITVLPQPISFELVQAEGGEKYHYVTVKADTTYLKDESLVFQGTITYPNGDVETFHLNENQDRQLSLFQADYGTFEVKTDVFGVDNDGREFVLSVPAFSFYTEMPLTDETVGPETSSGESNGVNTIDAAEEVSDANTDISVVEEKEEVSVGLIITLNLVILIIGFLVIWVFILKRTIFNPFKLIKFKKKPKKTEEPKEENKEKQDEKAPKKETSGDILDLSLPDD